MARLDAGDLNVIDTFFSRALDLDLDKRAEIAEQDCRPDECEDAGSSAGRSGAGAGAGVDRLYDAGTFGAVVNQFPGESISRQTRAKTPMADCLAARAGRSG